MRDFTIRSPLWTSSIYTYYQPWQYNNNSSLHQTILGPLPNLCATGAFFNGWHQWQPTLINNLPLCHWWQHSDAILKSYHSCSPYDHRSSSILLSLFLWSRWILVATHLFQLAPHVHFCSICSFVLLCNCDFYASGDVWSPMHPPGGYGWPLA